MQFGRGQRDFYRDQPEAPAQCVVTRLRLELAQWFLDLREGTPWQTRVLGKYTNSTRDPVIRARVLGTQGVSKINAYASQVDRDTRAFTGQITVDTIYGPGVVDLTAQPAKPRTRLNLPRNALASVETVTDDGADYLLLGLL
jgi:hypothetical protein